MAYCILLGVPVLIWAGYGYQLHMPDIIQPFSRFGIGECWPERAVYADTAAIYGGTL